MDIEVHEVAELSRRQVLRVLACLGAAGVVGCAEPSDDRPAQPVLPIPRIPPIDRDRDGAPALANLTALVAVLVPSEPDSPGALECGAIEVLALDRFVPAARAVGLLPPLPTDVVAGLQGFDDAFRAVLDADLDALASQQRPLTKFAHLPLALQVQAVRDGFADPLRAPLLYFVRAACFIAYFGAITSDAGLVAAGFPPFEDLANGIAVRGYPRTPGGRLIDAEREDLAALAARGELDDYTYAATPRPTVGDSLVGILDANGDLL